MQGLDETPIRTPPEVKREILRSRESSKRAVYQADLAALEILRLTSVSYSQSDEDALVHEISDLVVRYLQDHAQRHNEALQRDVDDLSTQLADQRMRATQAVRDNEHNRKAYLDFVEDGDFDRLHRRLQG